MNGIVVRKNDWSKYCESVGDHNLVHRDKDYVLNNSYLRKMGAKDVFAPGMYLASFIQGWPSIQSIKRIDFLPNSFVYDDDRLKLVALPNTFGKGIDYVLSKEGNNVCNISGVLYGDPDEKDQKPLKEISHIYETEIRPSDVFYYLKSLFWSPENKFPNMYLASLSAPALLEYGSFKKKMGLHLSQSFDCHYPFDYGLTKILIGNSRERQTKAGKICTYDLQAVQKDKIIASYKSIVYPLEEIVSEEVIKP